MAYKPLTFDRRMLNRIARDSRQSDSLMAKGGENLRDLPQLLNPKFALKIKNYLITGDGGLKKRGGITKLFEEVGLTNPITMEEKWTDDLYLYAYATTLKAYRLSDGSQTTIKSNFLVDVTSGAKYGDYFFIGSHGDKIGRVSQTLAYDTQTANFATGLVVTGHTSGATAIILEDSDSGATGTLTLGSIDGVFQDNEIITDSATGSATVNGTLGFTYTAISAAPIAAVVRVVGSRLYAGNLITESSTTQYCDTDTGSNPPFTAWSVGTTATQGGKLLNRNIGTVNDIQPLGNNVVIFGSEGKTAWQQTTIDSGGTLTKVDTLVMERKDFGGSRGSINTQKGLFYVNQAGLWRLTSIGQSNVPFSEQEDLETQLLGTDYFDNIDLSNADMAYDKRKNTLLITCARDSAVNNLVIAYNVTQKAVSEFEGWNINRFMTDGETIFGGGGAATKTWKLFDGWSDDGNDIWTEIYQELRTGGLETRQMLLGTYIQGKFNPPTTLKICYDIYDVKGHFIKDYMCQEWDVSPQGVVKAWGAAPWGGSGFSADGGEDTPIEDFAGGRNYIRNFMRLRVRITGHDQAAHELNFIKLMIRKSIPIRRRNLVNN